MKNWSYRSKSPYASSALLVNQKDGIKRLVIDYHALNKITVKNKFPMTFIEELSSKSNRLQIRHKS